jgi:hypothetical protein
MNDPWERLQTAAIDSLDWIWSSLAKEGLESGVFAPLGSQYPAAAGWLVECMSLSPDNVTQKLAAMLAGWIDDSEQLDLLGSLLQQQRAACQASAMDANSVVEDIMFAATRWGNRTGAVQAAGVQTLAAIVLDALGGIEWNTAHWAAANLYQITGGRHASIVALLAATPHAVANQPFLANFIAALKSGDPSKISRFVTLPSARYELPPTAPGYSLAKGLWDAAREAEAAANA